PGGFHAWRPARTMRDAQKEHQGTPEKKHQRGNTREETPEKKHQRGNTREGTTEKKNQRRKNKKEQWKKEPTQKRKTKNIMEENTKGTMRKKSSCLPLQIEGHREGICSQGGSHGGAEDDLAIHGSRRFRRRPCRDRRAD